MSSLRLVKTCQDEIQKVAPGPRWREALYQYLRHPDRHRDAIIHKSQEGFTTVYDGYPKATVHLLILPDQRIKTPQQLDRSGEFGTSFLRRVHKYAGWLIGELHKQEHLRELEFKIGIHAVPSMEPLHVHVISTDMRSNRIKHKKHWNSFTTPFFVELTQVEDILERDGELGRETPSHGEASHVMTLSVLQDTSIRSSAENLTCAMICSATRAVEISVLDSPN
ncbi:aprataxin-like protein [Perkinsus olseni]|uniref:Aprataxin-like protein n=1 Tax=Perkinsus olseni TaxID=32597 RepID=A0A7J6MH49_PEROL|nr:aprataxin-like protein [Perkinsus olseni]